MAELAATFQTLDRLPLLVSQTPIFVEAMDPLSIEAARTWLLEIAERVTAAGLRWREPHVSTDGKGHVELAWWHKHKALYVQVSAEWVATLQTWGSRINEEMKETLNPTPEQWVEMWQWLYE